MAYRHRRRASLIESVRRYLNRPPESSMPSSRRADRDLERAVLHVHAYIKTMERTLEGYESHAGALRLLREKADQGVITLQRHPEERYRHYAASARMYLHVLQVQMLGGEPVGKALEDVKSHYDENVPDFVKHVGE